MDCCADAREEAQAETVIRLSLFHSFRFSDTTFFKPAQREKCEGSRDKKEQLSQSCFPKQKRNTFCKASEPIGQGDFSLASFTVVRFFRRGEKDAKAARPEPGWQPEPGWRAAHICKGEWRPRTPVSYHPH